MNFTASFTLKFLDRLTSPMKKAVGWVKKLGQTVQSIVKPAEQAERKLGGFERRAVALGRAINGGLMGGLKKMPGLLKNVAIGLAGVSAAAFTAGSSLLGIGVWQTSKQFEKYTTVLRVALGSQEKANAAMSWVEDFAKRTPYDLAQVMEAYVKLTSYGIEPQSRAMRTLGDTAAGMGKDYNSAVEAMADAVTGEFERLKEFGVRAKVVGNQIVFSYSKAGKDIEVRTKKSAAAIQNSLLDIFDARFGGSMEALAKTGEGIESNIGDWFKGVQKLIGSMGIYDHVKKRLGGLMSQLDAMSANGSLAAWAKKMSDAMIKLFDAVDRFISGIDWVGLVGFITGVTNGITGFIKAVGGLGPILDGLAVLLIGKMALGLMAATTSIWGLNAALWGCPITWIIAGIAALAAGAYLIWRNWKPITKFFGDIWQGILDGVSGMVDGVVGFFTGLWNSIVGIWSGMPVWMQTLISLPLTIITHWKDIANFFAGIWKAISGPATAAWHMVSSLASAAWRGVQAGWRAAGSFFGPIWDGVITSARKLWTGLSDGFGKVWDAIKAVWNAVGSFFGPIWDGVITSAGKLWTGLNDGFGIVWDTIKAIWKPVGDWFGTVWKSIQDSFKRGVDALWNILPEWFRNILSGAKFVVDFLTTSGGAEKTMNRVADWADQQFKAPAAVLGQPRAIDPSAQRTVSPNGKLSFVVDAPPGVRVKSMEANEGLDLQVNRGFQSAYG